MGDCADLELDTFNFATFERNENRPIDSCNQGNGSTDIRLDRIELVEDSEANTRAESGEYFGKLTMHATVPGGFERLPFRYWEVQQLPHALHDTALPKADSNKAISVEIPFRVDYQYGYCNGGAHFNGDYVANESVNQGPANNFIFQLQTWIEFSSYSASSIEECTSAMIPRVSLQYKYFAHQRAPQDNLDPIAIAGDFNGTGNPHPAGNLDEDEILTYGVNQSFGSNDKLGQWAEALRFVQSSGAQSAIYVPRELLKQLWSTSGDGGDHYEWNGPIRRWI